jgi:hypothetical protein
MCGMTGKSSVVQIPTRIIAALDLIFPFMLSYDPRRGHWLHRACHNTKTSGAEKCSGLVLTRIYKVLAAGWVLMAGAKKLTAQYPGASGANAPTACAAFLPEVFRG